MNFDIERRVDLTSDEWEHVGVASGVSGPEACQTALAGMATVAGGEGVYRMAPTREHRGDIEVTYALFRIEADGETVTPIDVA